MSVKNSKLKLTYIVNHINQTTGLEKMVLVQADYFINAFDFDIDIISVRQSAEEPKPIFDFNKAITFHSLGIGRSPKNIPQSVKSINKKLKQINPDIVKVCIDDIFGLNLANLLKKKQPFIYQRHAPVGINFLYAERIRKLNAKDRFRKFLLSRSGLKYDRFVLLAEDHKKDWPHLSNIEVINNPNTLKTNGQQSQLDNKVVIAVGRHDYAKGYDMLLEAWQMVIRNHPDWVLKVYGKADESLQLSTMANELGLGRSVEFHDHSNDLISAYLEASIVVCSSRLEGFALTLVEAMSLGLPVVSFDCPYGPRAIINEPEDGILVSPKDIKGFSNAIQLLISDIELRKSMGKMAKINSERFEISRVMQKWKTLFDDVLQ